MLFLSVPLLIWLILHLILRSKPTREPYSVSHRGAGGLAPENTLAAVSEAITRGASFIEVDVQRSVDGTLVVIHDDTVDRTTDGTGKVGLLTFDEISSLDAGSYFSAEFSREPIPTLDAILELVVERQATLVLEAKTPKLYPGIERQIAEALQRADAYDQIIVISFDHEWLEHFHQLVPQVPLGKLSMWMGRSKPLPMTMLVDVYWLSVIADPTLISRAHAQGYQVVVWTVNATWAMKLLLWLGVDGVTTDRPDLWSQIVAGPQ
ncbi:MAG: glycerophosphodiester phosphodiesterase [Anaerolineae bacterium]